MDGLGLPDTRLHLTRNSIPESRGGGGELLSCRARPAATQPRRAHDHLLPRLLKGDGIASN